MFQADAFDLDSAVLGRRYPALVVLDANLGFATAVEIVRLLALGGEAEELIVVGVGSPWAEGMAAFGQRRFYEFSPAERWDVDGPYAEITKAAFAQAGVDPHAMGGAPKFLRLLTEEVLPIIARDYRADLTCPGRFGDSAGGTFAPYALLSGTAPFRKYICGSPATAQCNDELYRMEERYAATYSDLDAAMFLAAGSEEMSSPFLEGGGIASGVCRFSALFAFRQYPSFRLTSHFFTNEGHFSVFPAIISRGIRTLWDTKCRFGMPSNG